MMIHTSASAPDSSWTLRLLSTQDAAAAAELHRVGQPGTFLTRLGPAFLAALYAQMAASAHCTGFVAVDGAGQPVGVVVGSTDTSAVFREVVFQRGWRLAWPVLRAVAGDPALLPMVLRTALYPGQANADAPEAGVAELFYIGTAPAYRGQGLGRALLAALAETMRARGMARMGLVVAASNEAARRFYERQRMRPLRELTLYGRSMLWYELDLE